MKPGGEKSNCVSDHSDSFFNVPMIFPGGHSITKHTGGGAGSKV